MRSAAMALAALALAAAPAARADWLGKAEAGFVMARGNTDTDSGNAKVDVAYELEKWKHSNVIDRIKGEESDEAVANAGLAYQQQITASTQLIDKFLVEAGSENTFAQNDFAIEVAMTGTLAISLGYSVRHNTDPPVGLEKTDRPTTANLVYKLK